MGHVLEDQDAPSPAKIARRINIEHSYISREQPLSSKMVQKTAKFKRKIKMLTQKVRQKINKMTDLLKSIGEQKLLEEDELALLRNNFGGMAQHIFCNQLSNSRGSTRKRKYNQQIKQFALTLHYYSPKAYDYVRTILHLPHPLSIRSWAASVACEPGFLTNVIDAISSSLQDKPWMKDCVLILDAMAIRKETVWDPVRQCYVGCADYVAALPDAGDSLATEALVFMASGVTGHWKHPVAYFIVNKVSAAVQAQLKRDCLALLIKAGFNVKAVVFDGTFGNQSTAVKLGCKLNIGDMRPWFYHHARPQDRIYIVLDVCHMIKLMWNLLGDCKTIQHDNKLIKWQYIESLNALQEEEGLVLGNKLSKAHINFSKHKMNVRMAAQTISSSVADAIDFLREDLSKKEFDGSEDTTTFLRKIDKLFDILNTKNIHGKRSKAPLSTNNMSEWQQYLDHMYDYLMALKDEKGRLLRSGRRKTAIIGFAAATKSLRNIATDLFTQPHPYKFVLTYKFSQDHIELLFNKIRRRGGWNNNPNILQFKWALRRILTRNSISPSSIGNCTDFEESLCESLFEIRRKRSQQLQPPPDQWHDSDDVKAMEKMMVSLDQEDPNDIRDNIMYYIGGYLVARMAAKISCSLCKLLLFLNPSDPHQHTTNVPKYALLTARKQDGGLTFPSAPVLKIIKTTEVIFR